MSYAMKSFKLLTFFVSIYAMIIGMLVLQPGCNSLLPSSEADSETSGRKFSRKWNNLLGSREDATVIFDPSINAGYTIEREHCSDSSSHTSRQKPTKPSWHIAMEEKQSSKKSQQKLTAISRKEVLRPTHTLRAAETPSSDPCVDDNDVHEVYTVKSCDSLWAIAKNHGVTVPSNP